MTNHHCYADGGQEKNARHASRSNPQAIITGMFTTIFYN